MARYLSIDVKDLSPELFTHLKNTVPKAMLIVPDGTSVKHLLPLIFAQEKIGSGVVFISHTAPPSIAQTTKVAPGTWVPVSKL